MEKIVLASGSPRRKEIFELMGLDFEIITSNSEPPIDEGISAEQNALLSAKEKAMDVFSENNEKIVVGADTVVSLENTILGKPKDEADAFNMLKCLSARRHEVITAVYICSPKMQKGFCVKTQVEFYGLRDDEIKAYIKTREPMDKAGAYAIQGRGLKFVKGIIGDYLNVVGFPAAEFLRFLEREEL